MKVKTEQHGEVLLPDFLIVGAAKSATTSLYYYLNQHPQIRMTDVKESWVFSFLGDPPDYSSPGGLCNVITRVDDYSKLFHDATPDQRLGDASPSYLYTYETTIRNIKAVYPREALKKLRIVISLREPASRAFSQYWTFRRRLQEPLSFDEAVEEKTIRERMNGNWNIFYDYMGFGCYYKQVKAFLDAFGEEQVKIILFDDICKDPEGVLRSLCKFIDVDTSYTPDTRSKHNDVTGEPTVKWLVRLLVSQNPIKRAISAGIKSVLVRLPRKPTEKFLYGISKRLFKREQMRDDTRARLIDAYAVEVEKLERLIKRDLSSWRNSA